MQTFTNPQLATLSTLHTLGPDGTNLQAAAHEWFRRQGRQGRVVLYDTLESALPNLPQTGEHAILACAVYPLLHRLVFEHLDRLKMVDGFLMPTHNMVLASRGPTSPTTVVTHAAPSCLVPAGATVLFASSNATAAGACKAGLAEGCITTLPAARSHQLTVVHDFGPVPMIFTVHLAVPRELGLAS